MEEVQKKAVGRWKERMKAETMKEKDTIEKKERKDGKDSKKNVDEIKISTLKKRASGL
jgi:hypothetical protein